jgi:hypothetical protein
MGKLDLAKLHKSYYTAKSKPELVTIEPARFLSIAGKGDPSGPEFAEKIEALYGTAYTLKFAFKANENDFVVAKLEGLWWFDEQQYSGISIADAPIKIPRKEWCFRMLIRMPEFVTHQHVQQAIESVIEKKRNLQAANVHLYEMEGEQAVQMLHIGPFDKEPETLAQIGEFTTKHKLQKAGRHHEIYLSDFRKTAPEKLKTILREPVIQITS